MKKVLISLFVLSLFGSNLALAHSNYDYRLNRHHPVNYQHHKPIPYNYKPIKHKHNKIHTSLYYTNGYNCCRQAWFSPLGGINLHISL